MLTEKMEGMIQSGVDKWHIQGKIKRCHMAQAWDAMWHPIIHWHGKRDVTLQGIRSHDLWLGEVLCTSRIPTRHGGTCYNKATI